MPPVSGISPWLPCLVAGSSVQLRLGRCLQQRRFAVLLLKRLQKSLLTAHIARCALYVAEASPFRQEDAELLTAAAAAGWRPRLLTLLLGSHARVGADSPLRLLPPTLLQIIVELVAQTSRAVVEIVFGEPESSQTPRAAAVPEDDDGEVQDETPPHPMLHPGSDMDVVAQFAM